MTPEKIMLMRLADLYNNITESQTAWREATSLQLLAASMDDHIKNRLTTSRPNIKSPMNDFLAEIKLVASWAKADYPDIVQFKLSYQETK